MGKMIKSEALSQTDLKQILTCCPDHPPRTVALERRIKIGTGFHAKWYRSQREHWLGWIVRQEYIAIESGKDVGAITARRRWSGLNCIPMMFWLAEVAGVPDEQLSEVESAARDLAQRKPHDCPEHGKGIRQVLPWKVVEQCLLRLPRATAEEATQAGLEAFTHLATFKPKYRRYLNLSPGQGNE